MAVSKLEASARAGEKFCVAFNEVAGTGYSWTATSKDISFQKTTIIPGHGNIQQSIGGTMSAVFTATVEKPGIYEVEFTCKRPWENNAIETIHCTLTIEPK